MPYNRAFSLTEVEAILRSSELRPRPDLNDPKITGHSVSLHSGERKNIFSRPKISRDSMFLGTFNDYALAIHEILNSNIGQTELKKLNDPKCNCIGFSGVILPKRGEIDILTKIFPKERGSQGYFEWLSTLKGEGYTVQIFILLCKLNPPTANCDIHIQTAYPKQYTSV